MAGDSGDYGWVKEASKDTGSPSQDVFVHVRKGPGEGNWLNIPRRFLRVPAVGEYITLFDTSPWFRVELVVHCAFDADFGAEITCVEVDHFDVMRPVMRKLWPED